MLDESSAILRMLDPSTSEFPPLSIGITGDRIMRCRGQRHTGFVVQGDDRRLWLFDLVGSENFRKTEISKGYAHPTDDFFDGPSAATISAFLISRHKESTSNIKFSLLYDPNKPYFDKSSGRYSAAEPGDGFTCATFVLEILKHHGFDVIDCADWPIFEEDQKWQRGILENIVDLDPLPTKQHLEAQSSQIGGIPRYRPEHVVAATVLYDGSPLAFESLAPLSSDVLKELKGMNLDHGSDIPESQEL